MHPTIHFSLFKASALTFIALLGGCVATSTSSNQHDQSRSREQPETYSRDGFNSIARIKSLPPSESEHAIQLAPQVVSDIFPIAHDYSQNEYHFPGSRGVSGKEHEEMHSSGEWKICRVK